MNELLRCRLRTWDYDYIHERNGEGNQDRNPDSVK